MRIGSLRQRLPMWAVAPLLVHLFASQGQAQAIVDPRVAEFDPSLDHDALLPGSRPKVERYDLEFYQIGATQPFQVTDLGKPAPEADGKIREDFTTRLSSWPLPGVLYEARVTAVGSTGTGRSDVSNQFSFSAPCSYTIAPTSASVGGTGGSGTVTVTTGAGCTWPASSSASWITVSPTSGTASGSVSYTAAANTSTSTRTGTLAIGGQTFTVTQAGVCSYTIAPTSASVGGTGGSGTVTVTTGAGCNWPASSSASWITVSPTSGTGSGSVSYTVAANTSTSTRTGTLAISGQTFTVTQAGVCNYTLAPTSASVAGMGGSGTVTVTTRAGCTWTASSSASWITVSPTSGTGSGSVGYTVAANKPARPRTGTITIGGQTFTVTQEQRAPGPPRAPKKVRVVR